jgi:RNA polymerase sigma factor (sigma-70 family)
VSIDLVADLEALNTPFDEPGAHRQLEAREELRRVQAGLDLLPPRCREVVVARRIEGLSQRETAQRLGIGEDTVERQMLNGMRALVDFMLGGSGKLKRGERGRRADRVVTP